MGVEQTLEMSRLKARNTGGIDGTDVTFEPGVTVLPGRNATNRTSLLQAIMAANGSDHVSIKADAEETEVALTLGKEHIRERSSERTGRLRVPVIPIWRIR
jgi:recombinational DNA repair ATPase RecF